jgi:hypothetical protein
MAPRQDTNKQLIADIEKRLDKLTTVVEYEALKEISQIKTDIVALKENLKEKNVL